jgi:hypothetical protein
MKNLTKENLESIVRQIISDSPYKIYDDFKIYGLAIAILRYYFGNEWTDQNASAFFEKKVLSANRKGRIFLRTENPVAEDYFRHELRIFQLAELVFNLQNVDGIDERVTAIKKGDLEPTYGELECAAQIMKANLLFSFVKRSMGRGKDFDIVITPNSGTNINCEMKVTTEEKDLSKNTILDKFKKARKQLPKERPGIIFLKIPESWAKQSNAETMLNESLSEFLRNTNRVVAIVLRWEELTVDINKPKSAILKTLFRIEPNRRSKFYNLEIENILQQIYRPSEQTWTRFRDIVKWVKVEDTRLK